MKTEIIDRTAGGSATNIIPSSEQGATQYIFTFAYEEEDHPKIAVNPESGYIKNSGLVTVGPSIPASVMPPDDDMAEQEIEAAISAIADKHKKAIDNAHYNLMAVGQALVIAKDGSLECERVKFEQDNDKKK